MNKYKFSFTGRKVGNIGKTYKCTETIEAQTINEALDALYLKYEHIGSMKVNGMILSY